jgi:diguanylate cyclase (GGDEF)-like protein
MKQNEHKVLDLQKFRTAHQTSKFNVVSENSSTYRGFEMSKTIEDYITKVCAEVDDYFYDPLMDGSEIKQKLQTMKTQDQNSAVYDLNGDFIGYRTSSYKANHDEVTELPVLKQVYKRIAVALEQAQDNDKKMAVLSIRFNKLNEVNEKYGERMANRVLQHLASILKVVVRGSDTVGRTGDDQFAIVMTEMNSSQGIYRVINILLRLIMQPILIDDCVFNISANIGVVVYPDHAANPKDLYNHSVRALEIAQCREENSFVFFETCD